MKFFSYVRMTLQRVQKFYKAHPFGAIVIALAIVVGGYYGYAYFFSTTTETRYVLGTVERGTIVSTVSGSGQVSTSNKIDIKPQASGIITWVAVKPGDTVYQGQLIAQIDNADAKQAVVNAEQSLATSKLQYQRDSAQAPIDFQTAHENIENAQADLVAAYDDLFNSLSSTYLDLPGASTAMHNVLYGYDINTGRTVWNVDALANLFTNDADNQTVQTFADTASARYTVARSKYDKSVAAFKLLSRTSSNTDLERSLTDTITTTTALAEALQSEVNLLGEVLDLAQQRSATVPASVTTLQTTARTSLSTVNSDLSELIAQKKALANAKQNITSAQNTLTVLNVGNANGSNPISLQISANSIASAEANLIKLRRDLADYSIVAPFDGTISAVNAVRGDNAPSTVATIITAQKIAQLTLNEVDAAKVHLGDKATLTFDAIDELTLTGKVAEIDSVGTVSQGVVSYTVKINFDTQDERIKSGMTVNASIQTEVKLDVLMVPSSAVKTQNGIARVSVFETPIADVGTTSGVTSSVPPTAVEVTVGISDDTNIEIVTGLTEGQQIVTRTITGTNAGAATTGTSGGIGGPGIRL